MLVETDSARISRSGQLNKFLPQAARRSRSSPIRRRLIAAGLAACCRASPTPILCGDVSDYHLAFPQYEHRMRMMKEANEIDLGGRGFRAVEPVVRDMRTTWWVSEMRDRVLVRRRLRLQPLSRAPPLRLVAEDAALLHRTPPVRRPWRCGGPSGPTCGSPREARSPDREARREDGLPDPGLVIADVACTMPKVKEGLLYGRASPSAAPMMRHSARSPSRRRPK